METESREDYIKKENLETLKYRCRRFLNPKRNQDHTSWFKEKNNLYIAAYNVVAPDDGEDYYVDSKLERVIKGKKINYKLSFLDMEEVLDDQSYRPLRILGKKVFG